MLLARSALSNALAQTLTEFGRVGGRPSTTSDVVVSPSKDFIRAWYRNTDRHTHEP